MQTWTRSARLVLAFVLILGLLGGTMGCDDNNEGGSEGAMGVLFLSAAARHPELIESGQRIGLAMYLAQLKLDPATAGSLAQIARDEGPDLRVTVDEQFVLITKLVSALSDAADQLVVAANPEEVLGGIVMQPEFAEIVPLLGDDNPMNLAALALKERQALVAGIVAGLDFEDAARISGITPALQGCLRMYQGRQVANEDEALAITNEALPAVVSALGYDVDQEAWALEQTRPLLYQWVAQDEAAREQSIDLGVQQILMQVGPVEDVMTEQVSMVFLAIAAHEDAPELLDAIAAKGA